MNQKNQNSKNESCNLQNHNCPFADNSKEDIKKAIEEIIDEYIKERSLTYEEIEKIGQSLEKTIQIAIHNHESNCPYKESLQEIRDDLIKLQGKTEGKEDQQKNSTFLTDKKINIIVNIIIGLLAIGSFALTLLMKFGLINID